MVDGTTFTIEACVPAATIDFIYADKPYYAASDANALRRVYDTIDLKLTLAGRRTEIHDELPGLQQLQRLVDLLQLVGRAGTVPLLLRQLHVRVGEVVVQPGLVDLLALRLDFHAAGIIGRCPRFN